MACQRAYAGLYDDVTLDTEHISKLLHLPLDTRL